jgi:hypothetical protein
MIDLTDYRKEFGRFCSGVELVCYESPGDRAGSAELARQIERFAHLFDRGTVRELIELANSGESFTETEAAARRALAGAAANVYLDLSLRDHQAECRRCEAAGRIDWQGERLDLSTIPALVADVSERPARTELEQRALRARRNCSEPRSELIEARDDAAGELGFESAAEMGATARGIDLARWQRCAADFLEQTATSYFYALARLRARNDELQSVGHWLNSDLLRWRRLARFDRIFDGDNVNAAFTLALGWMHIDIDRQPNLQIEFEPDAGGLGAATLYRVQPPRDVRLRARVAAGAWRYREMFGALGRAQHQAWTSPDLFERYPEFVYAPDRSTALGFGELAANLHLDRSWVAALYTRGNEETAAELVSEFALLGLHRLREDCAKLLFLLEHPGAGTLAAETTETEYSEQLRAATGFGGDGPAYLWEPNGAAGVVDRLRAAMFETLLLDRFRSGYGNRWWSTRKASDELRDIWNTGSRYSVEELAASLGLGEIIFEPAADRYCGLVERN